MRAIGRIFWLIGLLLVGILIVVLFMGKSKNGIPDSGFQKAQSWWLGSIAHACGIRTQTFGIATRQPAMWVSNHVSWADITVLGGVARVGFLSKKEVKSWPVVGWVVARGGTLFIDRGGRDAANGAAKGITEHVHHGHSILVFPEGTTTNGDDVRHFHARLLAPALDNQLRVQPVAIKYRDERGNPSQVIQFIDNMHVLRSGWRVLTTKRIFAEVHFLPVVDAANFTERKKLSKYLQDDIGQVVRV